MFIKAFFFLLSHWGIGYHPVHATDAVWDGVHGYRKLIEGSPDEAASGSPTSRSGWSTELLILMACCSE
jgi:hypothetical protein